MQLLLAAKEWPTNVARFLIRSLIRHPQDARAESTLAVNETQTYPQYWSHVLHPTPFRNPHQCKPAGAGTSELNVQDHPHGAGASSSITSAVAVVPNGWIYERNDDNSARFLLGTEGSNPLICFGVNPSTAVPDELDQTLRRVRGYSQRNGFGSWMMFNLYPQRSTDPEGLHDAYIAELKTTNERRIAEFINGRALTLLAAWGEPITTRPYLRDMLADIVGITDASACSWQSIGALTTKLHPRHPSRGAYLPLRDFDIASYLKRL
ncbi:DUF1643 domain-containing protein [Leucobacter musarum]|uniref:DUF1643 domain-containing protein n=1 Tax=Leucobacter musarum TaxID=1930747 RepID=UPI0009E79A79